MPPHAAHLCVSPDGRLAYLSVHKNASTTLNFHFQRRLGWGRAWPEWFSPGAKVKDLVVDPDPEEVLVVTRRDPDRFFSGLATIDFSHHWAAAPWDDPHLWLLIIGLRPRGTIRICGRWAGFLHSGSSLRIGLCLLMWVA
jgi:hypothetical protein